MGGADHYLIRLGGTKRRNFGETGFVSKLYRAEANGCTILEFHRHDVLAIHESAIGGIEVVQLIIVAVTHQNSVSPGDIGIREANGVFWSSANRDEIVRQLNRCGDLAWREYVQLWHRRPDSYCSENMRLSQL